MFKLFKKRGVVAGVVVAALAAIILMAWPKGASAVDNWIDGQRLKGQSVTSNKIAEGGVAGSEVRNGSLTGSDVRDETEENWRKQAAAKAKADYQPQLNDLQTQIDEVETTPGEDGEDGKDGVVVPVSGQGTATVADVGGTFGKFPDNVRATILDTVDLPAGKYVVTGEGFFINNDATSGQSRMQLALRVEDGSDWGQDLGTCFTGAISPLKNRESHCSSTRVVTLAEDSIVKVFAFGYADDQGSADSGKVNATSFVTALPVQ